MADTRLLLSEDGETIGGGGFSSEDQDTIDFFNPVKEAVAGFGAGLLKDPIGGWLAEQALGESVADRLAVQLEAASGESTIGDIGEFIGEYLPYIVGGVGAYSAGARGAVRLASVVGKNADDIFLRQVAPETADQLAKRISAVGFNSTERAAQAVGGSAGFGAFEGTEALAGGADLPTALRAAATGAAISLAFETAIIGAGIGVGAAKGTVEKVGLAELKPVLKKQKKGVKKAHKNLNKLGTIVRDLNHSREQERELLKQIIGKAKVARKEAGTADIFDLASAARAQKLERRAGGLEKQVERGLKVEGRAKRKAITARDDAYKELKKVRLDEARVRSQIANPIDYMRTRKTPYSPGEARLWFTQLMAKVITTPEALRGKLGGFANQMVFKPLAEADMAVQLGRSWNEIHVSSWLNRTQRNMGFSSKQVSKDRNIFGELTDSWEVGGADGVRTFMQRAGRTEQQIQNQIAVFRHADLEMKKNARILESMGAEPIMSKADLAQRGLQQYVPHEIVSGMSDAKLKKVFAKYSDEAQAERMLTELRAPGLSKMGSFDYARVKEGSLLQKINDPDLGAVYESNYFRAVDNHLNNSRYRIEYGQRFGLDGELVGDIVRAIRRDAGEGAGTLANNIFDQILNQPYVSGYTRQLTTLITSSQIATKLGLAVIPNMSQTANTVAYFGVRKAFKSLKHSVKGSSKGEIEKAIGVLSALQSSMGSTRGRLRTGASTEFSTSRLGRASDSVEAFAGTVLNSTGFSAMEQFNRYYSGGAGRYVFEDNIRKFAQGKLRGHNFDEGIRQMDSLGISPDDVKSVVAAFKKEGEAVFNSAGVQELRGRAMYRAAQITQFTPGTLRRPAYWNHPVGKVVFQFKTFALNHGRFMKDQILAEAAAGNIRPLATVLSIYPIGGEIVGNIKALVKMKDRDSEGLERILENYTNHGGFGLVTDLFSAAHWGGFNDSLLGPGIGDMADFAEAMLQGDIQKFLKTQADLPTAQAIKAFMLGTAFAGVKTFETPLVQDTISQAELLFGDN